MGEANKRLINEMIYKRVSREISQDKNGDKIDVELKARNVSNEAVG